MKRKYFLSIVVVMMVAVIAAALVMPGIPHVLATGSPNWGNFYRVDLPPYNAACNGTDVSAAINQAIADASNDGNNRGRVIVPACATSLGTSPGERTGSSGGQFYGLAHPIVPKSYVELDMWGAVFKWVGNATGNWMMQNVQPAGQPLLHFDIYGGEFDGLNTPSLNGIQLDSW